MFKIPSFGLDYISLYIKMDHEIFVTLNDGSYAHITYNDYLINENEEYKSEIKTYKPILSESQKTTLKILEANDKYLLFIGSNGHIYVRLFHDNYYEEKDEDKKDMRLYEIKGTFDNGYVLRADDIMKIIAISEGIMTYYVIDTSNKTPGKYGLLKLSDLEAHYEKISYVYQKGK